MEKIIHKLINNFTEGVDTYTHNGSTWLIFSESKEWVIELTESKTLWYNYNFFNNVFSYTSMDVVDNQHYITKWVEDNIINKVKHTITANNHIFDRVEDAIQNGVKKTKGAKMKTDWSVDDTLENGVKVTLNTEYMPKTMVEDIIQSGVKHTEYGDWLDGDERLNDIVENGVRKTLWIATERETLVETTINNGVKKTYHDTDNYTDDVKEVIREGVRTSHPRQYVGEIIIDKVIDNGVIETHDDVYHHKGRIDGVIKNGVKETHREICEYKETIEYIIKTGIKETKTPGDGDIVSTLEWMKENNSNSYPKMIDDVIENGVKEVVSYDEHKRGPVNTFGYIDDIIKEGEKINGTYAGGQRQSEKCKSVVEYGTKNPTV